MSDQGLEAAVGATRSGVPGRPVDRRRRHRLGGLRRQQQQQRQHRRSPGTDRKGRRRSEAGTRKGQGRSEEGLRRRPKRKPKQGVDQGSQQAQQGVQQGKQEAQQGIEKAKQEAQKGIEKGKEEAQRGIEEAEKYGQGQAATRPGADDGRGRLFGEVLGQGLDDARVELAAGAAAQLGQRLAGARPARGRAARPVIAAKATETAIIRAPSGIASPARPSG